SPSVSALAYQSSVPPSMLKPTMRTTGNRKKTNSRASAGRAGPMPASLRKDMDVPGVDRDAHPRAGRRQGSARRLAHHELEPVVAGDPELDRAAEIDCFLDLAREDIGPA